ncbi:hypothetical protein [Pseudosulfitobacter sp. SM2401]|uniref:hypothetical protein n=1 Tax=Pseudosulfitobacter sp. SM2401 TaxID=3350098 RepID=UPI0036F3B750
MTFIRPDAARAIHRLREALVGIAILALGLLWVFGRPGLLQFLGYPVSLIGVVFILIGIQRARFRTSDDGAGAVQVDEGQITYFGPLTGGATALADLERLTLDRNLKPAHWRLDSPGTPALLIPVNAAGSDALFDAFARLPGLRTERMLSEMNTPLNGGQNQAVVIWERAPLRPAHVRLH